LGYSQFTNTVFIQMADLTGVFGVSFVIMAVNVALKIAIDRSRAGRIAYGPLASAVLMVAVVWLYGSYRLSQQPTGPTFKVAVIQANIPQELKWHEPSWPQILEKYFILTERAALEKPDLIIWPETAFPGYVGEHDDVFERLRRFVAGIRLPVLLGTVVTEEGRYYNSAIMLDERGETVEQYHKLHLVPFGEFIPFRRWLPFLSQIVPIADFTPGDQLVLFSGMPIPGGFNVLICFEDSIPGLSRAFVKEGSELFINITNDAWFKDTKAPFLHLQSSVFRAVENRRAVIRAANTGISGFIGADGRIQKLLNDDKGKVTYVEGFVLAQVMFHEAIGGYARWGDLFSYGAYLMLLALILQRQNTAAPRGQKG
jgi:apolipoprotein N-acyltransferase